MSLFAETAWPQHLSDFFFFLSFVSLRVPFLRTDAHNDANEPHWKTKTADYGLTCGGEETENAGKSEHKKNLVWIM